MVYVILPDLQVVLFFVCLFIKNFKKVFMRRLTMGSIIVYCTTIIPNILNKVANYMELRIVESWST